MSFSIAFIKDALREIVSEVKKQGEKIDTVLAEHEILKEAISSSKEVVSDVDEKRQAMLERMAKARSARKK